MEIPEATETDCSTSIGEQNGECRVDDRKHNEDNVEHEESENSTAFGHFGHAFIQTGHTLTMGVDSGGESGNHKTILTPDVPSSIKR